MRLFIEPTDMLMFRSGRPFDAGQDTFAESLFPPTPETMQGAVRAMIASYWHPDKNIAQAFADHTLTDLIGDRESYGRFRITGLSLGRYAKEEKNTIERLFPSPAHIMREELWVGEEEQRRKITRIHRLLPNKVEHRECTNFPGGIDYYLHSMQEPEEDLEALGGWLTENDLRDALHGEDIANIKTVKKDHIYKEEPRLGIVVQSGTKSIQDGFLYQTVMIRMNPDSEQPFIYGFVVDIELEPRLSTDEETQKQLHIPDNGWMTIGGEQRSAYFRVIASSQQKHEGASGKNTLIYLTTPAGFGVSGQPGWLPADPLHELPESLKKPQTVAINNYTLIGGWKLNPGDAKGENKAMRRCVPAGSVYFYKGKIDVPATLTDYGKEIGYGIVYKGEW